jgi:hypothetical protein
MELIFPASWEKEKKSNVARYIIAILLTFSEERKRKLVFV